MSSERFTSREKKTKSRLQGAGEIFAAGTVLGLIGVAGITLRHHREQTHRSVEVHPLLQKVIDAEQRTLGVGDTTIWAAVHRIHHQMTDASLYGFYEISRAITWAEDPKNRDKIGDVHIPDSFAHLDPFVDTFSRVEVKKIGALAEQSVKERLGDLYEEPTDYDKDKLTAILNPTKPTYTYPDYIKHTGEWTQDDVAQIFLTDPHSPALVNRENGVQGIALNNVNRYKHAADLFLDNPGLKPEDLQNKNGRNNESSKLDFVKGFVIPSAVVFIYRGFKNKGVKKEDIAIAAAAGTAINGVRAGTEILGGNFTNSMGHAGVLDNSRMVKALTKKKYDITLNPDGTLSTDTVHTGVMGRLLSWATFDEVGGQAYHHANPGEIAYTDKKGLAGLAEAPWGTFTSFIAHSKLSVLQPGKGFDLKEGERRPDVPHEGVELIQAARVRQHFPV